MKIDEALYQLKQNIKMHEIEGTTSNQNEREKALLDYITNLQEENERLNNQYDLMENSLDEKQEVIDKAIEIYENRNACKYKKERFMEDKSTRDLMYEILTGGDE